MHIAHLYFLWVGEAGKLRGIASQNAEIGSGPRARGKGREAWHLHRPYAADHAKGDYPLCAVRRRSSTGSQAKERSGEVRVHSLYAYRRAKMLRGYYG